MQTLNGLPNQLQDNPKPDKPDTDPGKPIDPGKPDIYEPGSKETVPYIGEPTPKKKGTKEKFSPDEDVKKPAKEHSLDLGV